MPNEKALQSKKELVAKLAESLTSSTAGVLVDYKGINVENDTKLRRELREAGISYSVVKNTMLRLALAGTGLEDMASVLEGTTALATSATDPVAAAKILCKYAEGSKGAFTVKAGFVDGKALDAEGVTALSKLPSKEELIAKTLGGLNAPIAGFANVVSANLRGLVVALNAIAQKSA